MRLLTQTPTTAARAISQARALPITSLATRTFTSSSAQQLSASASQRSADHADHFDPPTGWLFGVKPGEKAEKEGWENIWVYGFFGTMGLGVLGYAFKPDTSIQTWALEEARRRLEVEGILAEPESKS